MNVLNKYSDRVTIEFLKKLPLRRKPYATLRKEDNLRGVQDKIIEFIETNNAHNLLVTYS